MPATVHQLTNRRFRAGAVVRYRGAGSNMLVAEDFGAVTAVIFCPGNGVQRLAIESFATVDLVQVLPDTGE